MGLLVVNSQHGVGGGGAGEIGGVKIKMMDLAVCDVDDDDEGGTRNTGGGSMCN